jgi:hypothetical protein
VPYAPGALHPRPSFETQELDDLDQSQGGSFYHGPPPSHPFAATIRQELPSPFRFQEQPAKANIVAGRLYPVEDERSDPESAEAFQTLVEREGIQDRVDVLGQVLRTWVAEHVIQSTVDLFKASDEDFDELATELLAQGGASLSEPEQELLKSTTRKEQKIEYMMAKCRASTYPKARMAVERRMALFKYLLVKGAPGSESWAREIKYALGRIRELGKGYCLNNYQHNKCSAVEDGKGAEDYPVDARLVMHAVLTYLDEHCYSFRSDYYQECASRDAQCKKSVCIVQPRRNSDEPYYYLLIKRGGSTEEEEWRAEPGQDNLFDVLALFVYHVHEHCNGRLGNQRLDSIMNLDTVLETLYTY